MQNNPETNTPVVENKSQQLVASSSRKKIGGFRKIPKFWYKKSAITSMMPELLVPFSVIYYAGYKLFNLKIRPQKLERPVICVGNFTVGGAGKTPVALEIGKLLIKAGRQPAFISRGYLGSVVGPEKVDLEKHTAIEVGDEPLMLARVAPCWVGKDKLETAKAAIAGGADVIILDDGMQNNHIVKDLTIAIVDGWFGIGNGFTIPAGPLREPIVHAAKKADAVVLVGTDRHKVRDILIGRANIIIPVTVVPDPLRIELLKDKEKKFIAFAGIAHPRKFFDFLKDQGVNLLDTLDFPDHYNYSEAEIEGLLQQAKEREAELITTEKDATRIAAYLHNKINILPVTIAFPDGAMNELLKKVI